MNKTEDNKLYLNLIAKELQTIVQSLTDIILYTTSTKDLFNTRFLIKKSRILLDKFEILKDEILENEQKEE